MGPVPEPPAPRMVAVATILVVDDEPRIVQLVRDYLEHGGFTVLTASDGASALLVAAQRQPTPREKTQMSSNSALERASIGVVSLLRLGRPLSARSLARQCLGGIT